MCDQASSCLRAIASRLKILADWKDGDFPAFETLFHSFSTTPIPRYAWSEIRRLFAK